MPDSYIATSDLWSNQHLPGIKGPDTFPTDFATQDPGCSRHFQQHHTAHSWGYSCSLSRISQLERCLSLPRAAPCACMTMVASEYSSACSCHVRPSVLLQQKSFGERQRECMQHSCSPRTFVCPIQSHQQFQRHWHAQLA